MTEFKSQDFVEDAAQQVDIGASGERDVWAEHLRGRKAQGPAELAYLPLAFFIKFNGDSPVEQIHLTEITDHNIVGFQVAVEDSLFVGVLNRVANLAENFEVLL